MRPGASSSSIGPLAEFARATHSHRLFAWRQGRWCWMYSVDPDVVLALPACAPSPHRVRRHAEPSSPCTVPGAPANRLGRSWSAPRRQRRRTRRTLSVRRPRLVRRRWCVAAQLPPPVREFARAVVGPPRGRRPALGGPPARSAGSHHDEQLKGQASSALGRAQHRAGCPRRRRRGRRGQWRDRRFVF